MKKYLIRLSGYLIILLVLIFIALMLKIIRGNLSFQEAIHGLISNDRTRLLLIIAALYSFVYPLLVFGKKERFINGNFTANRSGFLKAFAEQEYTLSRETESVLVFRKKSGLTRAMSFGRDKIEVNISGNPVIIDGLKKELRKLDVSLDMNLLRRD